MFYNDLRIFFYRHRHLVEPDLDRSSLVELVAMATEISFSPRSSVMATRASLSLRPWPLGFHQARCHGSRSFFKLVTMYIQALSSSVMAAGVSSSLRPRQPELRRSRGHGNWSFFELEAIAAQGAMSSIIAVGASGRSRYCTDGDVRFCGFRLEFGMVQVEEQNEDLPGERQR